MTRIRALGVVMLVLAGAWMAYAPVKVVVAQELQRFFNMIVLDRLEIGTSVPIVMEGTGNDSFEFTITAPNPNGADFAIQLPPDDGDSGEQLQTDGSGILTWESAGSLRAFKNIGQEVDPVESLGLVLQAKTYHFTYKPGASRGTGDYVNDYVGVMGDEAPWAMHHSDEVFDPVSAFGRVVGAIQAQQAQIDVLKAKLATLKARR